MSTTARSWIAWVLPTLTVLIVLLLWQLVTVTGVVSPTAVPDHDGLDERAVDGADFGGTLGRGRGDPDGLADRNDHHDHPRSRRSVRSLAFNDFAQRSAAPVIETFKAIPADRDPAAGDSRRGFEPADEGLPDLFRGLLAVPDPGHLRGAVDGSDRAGHRARRSGSRRRRQVPGRSVIPSASPYLVTGMRIASAQALILAVVAEIVGGAEGIGRNILLAQNIGSESPTRRCTPTSSTPVMLGIALTGRLLPHRERKSCTGTSRSGTSVHRTRWARHDDQDDHERRTDGRPRRTGGGWRGASGRCSRRSGCRCCSSRSGGIVTANSTSPFFPPLGDILVGHLEPVDRLRGLDECGRRVCATCSSATSSGRSSGIVGGSLLWRLRYLRVADEPDSSISSTCCPHRRCFRP